MSLHKTTGFVLPWSDWVGGKGYGSSLFLAGLPCLGI